MICPLCNTDIPDGLRVCPACRGDLASVSSSHAPEGDFCPACGALLAEGADCCPSCGLPVAPRASEQERPAWAMELPEVEEAPDPSEMQTTVIPRIESAISAEGEFREDAIERAPVPRARPVLLVAMLALLVVGGAVLAVAHPWDPNAYDQRSTTERDTSWAGFPGFFERLSGQDSTPEDEGEVVSGDQATYERLLDMHTRLGELARRADENVATLRSMAAAGTFDGREAGSSEAVDISLETSNLLADLAQVDVSSGTYAQDVQNLSTLGNWLRNRCDSLTAAWDVLASYEDPSQAADPVLSALAVDDDSLGRNAYMSLFHDHYDGWAPSAPAS